MSERTSEKSGVPTWVVVLVSLAVLLIVGLILWSWITARWLDIQWFGIFGYASVFWKIYGWKWILGLGGGIVAWICLGLNARIAKWIVPKMPEVPTSNWPELRQWKEYTLVVHWICKLVLPLIAFLAFGFWAASGWDKILRYSHQVSFGQTDPVFGIDLGFYLFSMPAYQFILNWLLVLGIVTLVVLFVIYLIYDSRTRDLIDNDTADQLWYKGISSHLALVFGLIVLVLAIKLFLAKYALLYNPGGLIAGAGYTDIHARIPAYTICFLIGLVAVIASWITAISNSWKPAAWVAGIWILSLIIILGIYPACVQAFSVRPTELEREKPYIARSIEYTKEGFGLADVKEEQFQAKDNPTFAQIKANPQTIQNIRLWDYRPLLDTLKQEQELRLYYEFRDTDIDRYRFGDNYRQVMLSPRELNRRELPEKAQQWVPQRLQYTHGYGLCLVPVNEATSEGRPKLWIADFPPKTNIAGFPEVTQPRIYYGEMTDYRVYVNTGINEIDYPIEEGFAETRYNGTGGIQIGSGLRKFILAWKFDFFKILLSKYIQPESKILWRRTIDERIRTIAPFLRYDHDPYMVIDDQGKLWWIRDAYTVANTFPYSEPYIAEYVGQQVAGKPTPTGELNNVNYVRNSVKVVIDAYNGSVFFYVIDPDDPVIATYSRIFPKLFKSINEMPQDIRTHIRYPETLFLVQANIYTDYHMSLPQVFYTREDKWSIAQEVYWGAGHKQPVEPYYNIMKVPGEKKEEFILMLPFTPKAKPNMIAWMAARCDEPNYGQLLVFLFPKGKLIHGPIQVENRIDQDPTISSQLTLWSQGGSSVIRGNLLVIPIEDSLLYVEPLYLQAEAGKYPELKRVLVAIKDRVVMAETLDSALRQLFTEVSVGEGIQTVSELISSAQRHLEQAEKFAGQGKWERQGAEIEALKRDLAELAKQAK